MLSLGSAQYTVFLILGVLAFIVQIYAVVDGARRRADAYAAAGKMTKQRWMIILGVAVAIGFISFNGFILSPLNILNIVAFVAASVYLVDVRPALKQVSGGGRGGSRGVSGPW